MILMDIHSIDLPTLYELIDFTLCDGTRLKLMWLNILEQTPVPLAFSSSMMLLVLRFVRWKGHTGGDL